MHMLKIGTLDIAQIKQQKKKVWKILVEHNQVSYLQIFPEPVHTSCTADLQEENVPDNEYFPNT